MECPPSKKGNQVFKKSIACMVVVYLPTFTMKKILNAGIIYHTWMVLGKGNESSNPTFNSQGDILIFISFQEGKTP